MNCKFRTGGTACVLIKKDSLVLRSYTHTPSTTGTGLIVQTGTSHDPFKCTGMCLVRRHDVTAVCVCVRTGPTLKR